MGKENRKVKFGNHTKVTKADRDSLSWDDLLIARTDAIESIVTQQYIVAGFSEKHQKLLEEKPEVNAQLLGLSKSLQDLVFEATTIGLEHSTKEQVVTIGDKEIKVPVSFKTGKVDTTVVDELEFIGIGGKYITLSEQVIDMTSTAYIDVYSELKVDASELKDLVKNGGTVDGK